MHDNQENHRSSNSTKNEDELSEAEAKLGQVEAETNVKLGPIPFIAAMSAKADPNG